MPVTVVATMTAKPESVDAVRDACTSGDRGGPPGARLRAVHPARGQRHVRLRRAVGRRGRAEDAQHRPRGRRAVRHHRRAPRRRARHQDAAAGRRGRPVEVLADRPTAPIAGAVPWVLSAPLGAPTARRTRTSRWPRAGCTARSRAPGESLDGIVQQCPHRVHGLPLAVMVATTVTGMAKGSE